MRINMVINQKWLDCLDLSEGRMECKIVRWIEAVLAAMWVFYQSVLAKRKLSWKAILLRYQLIYTPTHMWSWALSMTKRTRLWIQAFFTFLRRCFGHVELGETQDIVEKWPLPAALVSAGISPEELEEVRDDCCPWVPKLYEQQRMGGWVDVLLLTRSFECNTKWVLYTQS